MGGAEGRSPPSNPLCITSAWFGGVGAAPRVGFWGWARGWGACGLPPPVLTQAPFVPQKMEMVPVPTKSYGNFYEGDCYILLSVGCRGGGGDTGSAAGCPWP